MLLGFKRRFAPLVEEGSKTHTIRSKLKTGERRAGMRCDCYVDSRQKSMRLLGRWRCVKVDRILMYLRADNTLAVFINDVELDRQEIEALAWRDGFRTYGKTGATAEMVAFWEAEHGTQALDEGFEGDLIHWDYAQPQKKHNRPPEEK